MKRAKVDKASILLIEIYEIIIIKGSYLKIPLTSIYGCTQLREMLENTIHYGYIESRRVEFCCCIEIVKI